MKRTSIIGLSLTIAVATSLASLACKPCSKPEPCRDRATGAAEARKATRAMATRERTATAQSREDAQTCATEFLDEHGNCNVEKMWPKCEDAQLAPAGLNSNIKRCETKFIALEAATAADLKYPQCELICRDNAADDTRLCDDPTRCAGLPDCAQSADKERCCHKTVDQKAIDRSYLEFAWRVFISMNMLRASEPKPVWLSWPSPFGLSPEAESVLPINTPRADSSARTGLTCENRDISEMFFNVPWYETEDLPPVRSPRSNPISYTAPDGSAYVQFQILASPEARKADPSLVTNACRQALRAASRHRLEERNWWQGQNDKTVGPLHIKAAWIRVPETACGKEFICGTPDDGPIQGLVALHVVAKNNHSGQPWTWATFEHVRAVNADGERPALFAGTGEPNQCPTSAASPTHITRVQLDYDGAADYRALVDEINKAASQTLKREATSSNGLGVLARYRLVGVQRPRTERSKVIPWPPKLSNAVIEWDRQDSSCMGCHTRALSWRLCEPGESGCEECNTGCPTVKRDWVKQRSQDLMFPQADMFWSYAGAKPDHH